MDKPVAHEHAHGAFLELDGVAAASAGNDDVYNLVVSVAAGHQAIDEIATALRDITSRTSLPDA